MSEEDDTPPVARWPPRETEGRELFVSLVARDVLCEVDRGDR